MNWMKVLRRLARVSIVSVFLIILAGSVVRMTGSGMGCPDWPKCFGLAIPPTEVDQVLWSPNTSYASGQMILHKEALWKATEKFTSGETLDLSHWEKYTKHDYAIFNAFHTWVEFINRLIGALSGIPIFFLFVVSMIIGFKEKKWLYALLCFGSLFMMGFEAWLGKLVVDGNLIPGSITIHMLGALIIVFLLGAIIRKSQDVRIQTSKRTKAVLTIFLMLALIQLLFGTQVREEIDYLLKEGVLPRGEWVESIGTWFLIHRSFSWIMLAGAALLVAWDQRSEFKLGLTSRVGVLVLVQVMVGVGLAWFEIPPYLQPTHLVGSILLLALVWDRILIAKT